MNVLVAVDDCFLDRPGGMGRVAWDVACLMRDAGHAVTLAAVDHNPRPGRGPVVEEQGVRILRYARPAPAAWDPRRMGKLVSAAGAGLRRHLPGEKFDVAHLHSPFTGAGVLEGLPPDQRYVYTMHSPVTLESEINWGKQGLLGRVKKWLGMPRLLKLEGGILRGARRIHTLSQFTRGWIGRLYGLADKVSVIPHWRRPELRREIDKAAARKALGWPLDEKIVFTVRIHGPRYGLDVAIRAIGPLTKSHGCRFYIGGDGPLRPTLEALARELGVSDRVRFMGRLSDPDLKLAYQAADLFVLPTLALECFGLITVEAMSFGVPVIGTDAGATPEILEPLLPNCIVPAGGVATLAERVRSFLDGKLVTPDEQTIIDHIESRFSRDVVAPQLVEMLESAAK
ncbi:MAG: glycosyltransferase family 4 protein [Phycisphaerales bacterium]|nr:glycosyltransferase family 4 protein [Phycisphaerales bacterium]